MKLQKIHIDKRARTVIIHLLAWLAYGCYLYVANVLIRPQASIKNVLFYLIPFCFTFYIVLFLLSLYSKKGILWNIIIFFGVFLFMSVIGYAYIYLILPKMGIVVYSSKEFGFFLQEAMMGYFKYFALALLYYYVSLSLKKDKKLSGLFAEKHKLEIQKVQHELENAGLKQQELKARQEKLEYEYAYLRAQINPHFLHNTLNMLYSEAVNYSTDLAENILRLSSIMRYSLESLEYESGKVMVQKELEQLQTLIDINNQRFDKTKNIIYRVKGNIEGQMVPPMAFITIVENAFKYGDLKDPDHPLRINVELKSNEVHFCCSNKKKTNGIQLSSFNIGISNLTKRLDVAFKDRYEMNARNEEGFYNFELKIKN